jgi:protein-disulfide isomerase
MQWSACGGEASSDAWASNVCPPFTGEIRDTISSYIHTLAKVPQGVALNLVGSELAGDTCYRKLEFLVGAQMNKIVLYLSPDQRFLSSQLFDTQVEPGDAENTQVNKIREDIDSFLSVHKRPILGKANAPIAIAVFSDFQCPYCKQAMEILTKEVLQASEEKVRIAYFNFPLTSHPWARQAAEAAACLHASTSFWNLHEFIFDHQREMSQETLQSRLTEHLAESGPDEDIPAFVSCIGSKQSANEVDDDIAFGVALNVSGTPTLFVNGRRIVGLKSAQDVLKWTQNAKDKPRK